VRAVQVIPSGEEAAAVPPAATATNKLLPYVTEDQLVDVAGRPVEYNVQVTPSGDVATTLELPVTATNKLLPYVTEDHV
jgi:hypothetical protein